MKPTFPEGFEPTHEGFIYGIPIWWDARTFSAMGKNKFYNWLCQFASPIYSAHIAMMSIFSPGWESPGFPFKLRPLPGFEDMSPGDKVK